MCARGSGGDELTLPGRAALSEKRLEAAARVAACTFLGFFFKNPLNGSAILLRSFIYLLPPAREEGWPPCRQTKNYRRKRGTTRPPAMELLPDDILGTELFARRGLTVADLVSVSRTCRGLAARVRNNPAWLLGPRVKLECVGVRYRDGAREPCPAFELTLTSEYPPKKLAYIPASITAFQTWIATVRTATPAVSLRLDVDRLDMWSVIYALSTIPLAEMPRFDEITVRNRTPARWAPAGLDQRVARLAALPWAEQVAIYSHRELHGIAVHLFRGAKSVCWKFDDPGEPTCEDYRLEKVREKCIIASVKDVTALRAHCQVAGDATWRVEYHSGFAIGGNARGMTCFEPVMRQRDCIEAAFGADIADTRKFDRALTACAVLHADRQVPWDARPVVTSIGAVRRVRLRIALPMGACRFAPQNRTLDKLYLETARGEPGPLLGAANVLPDVAQYLWRARTLVIRHWMTATSPRLSWFVTQCFCMTAPARRVTISSSVLYRLPARQIPGLSTSSRTARVIRFTLPEISGEFVFSGRIDKTAHPTSKVVSDTTSLEYCGEKTLEELGKALPRLTWINLGEALVAMQPYILDALPVVVDEESLGILGQRQQANPILALIGATQLHREWYCDIHR